MPLPGVSIRERMVSRAEFFAPPLPVVAFAGDSLIDTLGVPRSFSGQDTGAEDQLMKCRVCGSANLKKSKRGNAAIVFPVSLFVTSVRCCSCGRRFLSYGLLPGRGIPDAAERIQVKSTC
jgi:hypothetical protein